MKKINITNKQQKLVWTLGLLGSLGLSGFFGHPEFDQTIVRNIKKEAGHLEFASLVPGKIQVNGTDYDVHLRDAGNNKVEAIYSKEAEGRTCSDGACMTSLTITGTMSDQAALLRQISNRISQRRSGRSSEDHRTERERARDQERERKAEEKRIEQERKRELGKEELKKIEDRCERESGSGDSEAKMDKLTCFGDAFTDALRDTKKFEISQEDALRFFRENMKQLLTDVLHKTERDELGDIRSLIENIQGGIPGKYNNVRRAFDEVVRGSIRKSAQRVNDLTQQQREYNRLAQQSKDPWEKNIWLQQALQAQRESIVERYNYNQMFSNLRGSTQLSLNSAVNEHLIDGSFASGIMQNYAQLQAEMTRRLNAIADARESEISSNGGSGPRGVGVNNGGRGRPGNGNNADSRVNLPNAGRLQNWTGSAPVGTGASGARPGIQNSQSPSFAPQNPTGTFSTPAPTF